MDKVYVITVTRKNCCTDTNIFKELRPAVDFLNDTLKLCGVFSDPAEQKAEMRRILEQGVEEGGWCYIVRRDPNKLKHSYSVAQWSIGVQPIL